MDNQEQPTDELVKELQKLQKAFNSLKVVYDKNTIKHHKAEQALIIANKELVFQNE
ncbi:MAG: hypothetical protein ACI81W_001140 [Saprospiraceae bacterium]|jgi:hypothetical protein